MSTSYASPINTNLTHQYWQLVDKAEDALKQNPSFPATAALYSAIMNELENPGRDPEFDNLRFRTQDDLARNLEAPITPLIAQDGAGIIPPGDYFKTAELTRHVLEDIVARQPMLAHNTGIPATTVSNAQLSRGAQVGFKR